MSDAGSVILREAWTIFWADVHGTVLTFSTTLRRSCDKRDCTDGKRVENRRRQRQKVEACGLLAPTASVPDGRSMVATARSGLVLQR